MIVQAEHKKATNEETRCNHISGAHKCLNEAMPGLTYCIFHAGPHQQASQDNEDSRKRVLHKWKLEIAKYAEDPKLKTLHQEIGIQRMLLDQQLARCRTPNDLIVRGGAIGDIVSKIEKLVVSASKLDIVSGNTIDRTQLSALATSTVAVITKYISDPETLANVANDLMTMFSQIGSPEQEVQSLNERLRAKQIGVSTAP